MLCDNKILPEETSILFLDIEGGFGGSSRSLFYVIEALDREKFVPVVLSRQRGPMEERYQRLGVTHHVIKLPAFRPAERNNWFSFGIYLGELFWLPKVKQEIQRYCKDRSVALVHVNHEGLALLGRWISKKFNLPWICHIRTRMSPSFWSRRLYKTIDAHAKEIIFITENEKNHFRHVLKKAHDAEKGLVIHNSLGSFSPNVEPLPQFMQPENAFRVISLSNLSPNRGTDLIADVAEALRKRGRDDFVFYLCGRLATKSLKPWAKDRFLKTMLRDIKERRLEGIVRLPGHIEFPERALVSCDALLQVRRRANPWGREIMEAMACGLPVVAVGQYQGFVEHGVNGFLAEKFSPEVLADYLVRLKDDSTLRAKMSANNKSKAQQMFDGRATAAKLEQVYMKVLHG